VFSVYGAYSDVFLVRLKEKENSARTSLIVSLLHTGFVGQTHYLGARYFELKYLCSLTKFQESDKNKKS